MHRIDGPGATAGNLFQKGTLVTKEFQNDTVQEELCNVVEGAGITLSKPANNQLLLAIQSLIDSKIPSSTSSVRAGVESNTAAGIKTADTNSFFNLKSNSLFIADKQVSLNAYTTGGLDIGGIYMACDDTGIGGDQAWIGSVLKVVPDAGATETEVFFETFLASGSPPASIVLQWDNNWVDVYSMLETGALGGAGTWTRLEARGITGSGGLQFRVSCSTDGAGDTSQSQIGFTTINF